MRAEVLERQDDKLKLLLEDTHIKFINALRRTILTEVPTLAVDDVKIYENSSVLFDEIIAHRLGMIPIKTPEEVLETPNLEVEFNLEKEGPTTVYSGDLKTEDPEIEPANTEIPIIKLGENQTLSLLANVTLGEGKDHAKWQPGTAYYKELEYIVFDCTEEEVDCEELKDKYSNHDIEETEDELKVLVTERMNVKKEIEDYTRREEVPGSYVFTVESNGELPVDLMVKHGIKVLENKSDEFIDLLEKNQ